MRRKMGIALGLLLITALAFVAYAFKSNDIETPQFTVLRSYGEVQIRQYPQMLVAKTSLSNRSYEKSGSNGFRTIAGYIFGGNKTQQKIAMTAPVVMEMGDSASMYFVMPKSYSKSQLPEPNSADVSIVEESAKVLAVITYGGFSSDEKIKLHCAALEKVLLENNIQTKGSFMFMGYNAPWDVVNRKNEVAIEIISGF
jgi:hypothetical protein